MVAEKLKKFFKRKKLDTKFKFAGPGHRLNENASTSTSSNINSDVRVAPNKNELSESAKLAAQAAINRNLKTKEKFGASFDRSLMAIKAQAKKEMELELEHDISTKLNFNESIGDASSKKDTLAVRDVFFQCPIVSNEILTKNEWKTKIQEFLYEQLKEESGMVSCLIIQSCNGSNKTKIADCIQILTRYLENIINNPDEPKYRKIRMLNRVFQDKLLSINGALEFLESAGFKKVQENNEEFLIYENSGNDFDKLSMLLDALQTAEPIPIELDRNMQVLLPSQANHRTELPQSFFALTVEELKNEQKNRSETADKNTQLRTKAMREKDELREIKKYKYSVIRIRFPDSIFLQGTFSIYENVSSVIEFVKAALENEDLEFSLITLHKDRGATTIQQNDYDKSLLEMKLVPATVLIFSPKNTEDSKSIQYLKSDVLMMVSNV